MDHREADPGSLGLYGVCVCQRTPILLARMWAQPPAEPLAQPRSGIWAASLDHPLNTEQALDFSTENPAANPNISSVLYAQRYTSFWLRPLLAASIPFAEAKCSRCSQTAYL